MVSKYFANNSLLKTEKSIWWKTNPCILEFRITPHVKLQDINEFYSYVCMYVCTLACMYVYNIIYTHILWCTCYAHTHKMSEHFNVFFLNRKKVFNMKQKCKTKYQSHRTQSLWFSDRTNISRSHWLQTSYTKVKSDCPKPPHTLLFSDIVCNLYRVRTGETA